MIRKIAWACRAVTLAALWLAFHPALAQKPAPGFPKFPEAGHGWAGRPAPGWPLAPPQSGNGAGAIPAQIGKPATLDRGASTPSFPERGAPGFIDNSPAARGPDGSNPPHRSQESDGAGSPGSAPHRKAAASSKSDRGASGRGRAGGGEEDGHGRGESPGSASGDSQESAQADASPEQSPPSRLRAIPSCR